MDIARRGNGNFCGQATFYGCVIVEISCCASPVVIGDTERKIFALARLKLLPMEEGTSVARVLNLTLDEAYGIMPVEKRKECEA